MNKCFNCEKNNALWKCRMCPPSDSLLCSECKEFHSKIKSFHNHNCFEDIVVEKKPPIIFCKNCDTNIAKYICLQCKDENRFLCVGCSLFHSKVKAFRGHSSLIVYGNLDDDSNEVDNNDESVESTSSHFQLSVLQSKFRSTKRYLRAKVLRIMENLTERSYHDFTFWQSLIIVFTFTFLYCLLAKTIFGSLSLLVNALLAIMVFGNYQNLFNGNVSDLKHLKQESDRNSKAVKRAYSNRKSFDSVQLNHEEFPDEFSYKLNSSPSRFRQRGKPYKKRVGNGGYTMESDTANGDADTNEYQ